MISRWSLPTKLAALVLAPLLALGGVAGLVVFDRLAAARRANAVRDVVELSSQVSPVLLNLQRERSIVGARILGDDAAISSRYELQGAITAKVVDEFANRSTSVRRGGAIDWSSVEIGRALVQAGSLEELRQEVAAGDASNAEAQAAYTEAIDRFLAVSERLGDSTQDPDLARRVDAAIAADRAAEQVARQAAVLGGAYAGGSLDRRALVPLAESRQTERIHLETLRRSSPATQRAVDALYDDPTVVAADGMRDEAMDEPTLDPAAAGIWRDSAERKRQGLQRIGDDVRRELVAAAATAEERSRQEAMTGAGAGAGLLLLTLLLVTLVSRSIVRPMRRLTDAATDAAERLPHVVEALAQPGAPTVTSPEAIAVPGPELGQLADAFNNVNRVAIDVAGEQAALRAGIAEMFTNVARRSQALVERQIGFIDSLEHQERDADALQNLFHLDHLATRMRRNAESLLILAGAEAPRRWRDPVLLRDVIRAAAGEVEDFSRVNVADTGWLALPGPLTAGAVHLLAELIENACRFSPPDTPVDVRVTEVDDHYAVTVHDRGLGMSDLALEEANEKLAKPPLLEAAVTGQLGLFVVGRIAGKLGVKVRLTRSPWGGVSAHLFLPRHLVLLAPPVPVTAPTAAPATAPQVVPVAAAPAADRTGPAAPSAAAPADSRTASGLARRVPRAGSAPTAPAPEPSPVPVPAEAPSPMDVQAAMARFQSGLARGRAAAAETPPPPAPAPGPVTEEPR